MGPTVLSVEGRITVIRPDFWQGKRVFVTGHTGFKGGWLAVLLHKLGAKVSGYALPPIADKVVYIAAGVERRLHSVIGDITDAKALNAAMREAAPEIVFHLAAQ